MIQIPALILIVGQVQVAVRVPALHLVKKAANRDQYLAAQQSQEVNLLNLTAQLTPDDLQMHPEASPTLQHAPTDLVQDLHKATNLDHQDPMPPVAQNKELQGPEVVHEDLGQGQQVEDLALAPPKAVQLAPSQDLRALNLDPSLRNPDRRVLNLVHKVLNQGHKVQSLGLRVGQGQSLAVQALRVESLDPGPEVLLPRVLQGLKLMIAGPTLQGS